MTTFVCRIDTLDGNERRRQQELLALMRRSAQAPDELPEGYEFRLPTDPVLFQRAAEWIGLERRSVLSSASRWNGRRTTAFASA